MTTYPEITDMHRMTQEELEEFDNSPKGCQDLPKGPEYIGADIVEGCGYPEWPWKKGTPGFRKEEKHYQIVKPGQAPVIAPQRIADLSKPDRVEYIKGKLLLGISGLRAFIPMMTKFVPESDLEGVKITNELLRALDNFTEYFKAKFERK